MKKVRVKLNKLILIVLVLIISLILVSAANESDLILNLSNEDVNNSLINKTNDIISIPENDLTLDNDSQDNGTLIGESGSETPTGDSIIGLPVEPPINGTEENLPPNETEEVPLIEEPIELPIEENIIGLPVEELEQELNETEPEVIEEPSFITTIISLVVDKITVFVGEIINIQAVLKYENQTPIPEKQIDFYTDTYIGSDVTDEEGKAEIDWNTSSWLPDVYNITASYAGDEFLESSSASIEVSVDGQLEEESELNETETLLSDNESKTMSFFIPKNGTIVSLKKTRNDLPSGIIKASDNYVRSFVAEEELNKNFRFEKGLVIENPVENTVEYLLAYGFMIESYRENGKKTRSVYPIQIRVDEAGEIIDTISPIEKYEFLKARGT